MEMEELLAQIKELCAGKTAEEIEQDISETSHAERIPNAAVLAKLFASLAEEPEDEPVMSPDDEPVADIDVD